MWIHHAAAQACPCILTLNHEIASVLKLAVVRPIRFDTVFKFIPSRATLSHGLSQYSTSDINDAQTCHRILALEDEVA